MASLSSKFFVISELIVGVFAISFRVLEHKPKGKEEIKHRQLEKRIRFLKRTFGGKLPLLLSYMAGRCSASFFLFFFSFPSVNYTPLMYINNIHWYSVFLIDLLHLLQQPWGFIFFYPVLILP